MRVLIVRHAIAAARGDWRGPEDERPLTEEGVRRFRRAAPALVAEVPDVGLVATSPLERARATAELLQRAFPAPPPLVEQAALAPSQPTADVLGFLRRQRGASTVAVVGHEPGLSQLEASLLTGAERPVGALKKGGAALIEFAGAVAAGRGRLVWHLTAAQLRGLAR